MSNKDMFTEINVTWHARYRQVTLYNFERVHTRWKTSVYNREDPTDFAVLRCI